MFQKCINKFHDIELKTFQLIAVGQWVEILRLNNNLAQKVDQTNQQHNYNILSVKFLIYFQQL